MLSYLLMESQVTSAVRCAFVRRAARRKVGSFLLATVVNDKPVAKAERSRVMFKSIFIFLLAGVGFLPHVV